MSNLTDQTVQAPLRVTDVGPTSFVFLAVIGTAAVLITVGHLSPPNLAAYGAVVTSVYAAWRSQRRRLGRSSASQAGCQ